MAKEKLISCKDYNVIPECQTCREIIESGHKIGGDNPQYLFPKKKEVITKTFNQVWYDTVGLGQYLYMQGLNEKKVAILSGNGYHWIACFYSVMTGRHPVIALDPKLTDDEIMDIMRRSRCDAIYYSDDYAETIEKMKKTEGVCVTVYMKISELDKLIKIGHDDLDAGHKSYLDEPPKPGDLAAICFSSGTTGRSKGVMLSHRNIASNVCATGRLLQNDHGIGFLPMNHLFAWAGGLFLTNLIPAWGYLCRSLLEIPEAMKTYHPTCLSGVPMLVEIVYKNIWKKAEESGQKEKLEKGLKISNFLYKHGIDVRRKLFRSIIDGLGGSLQYICSGGAYSDPELERKMSEFGIDVYSCYGITECSPTVTMNTIEDHKIGSVGKPVGCNQIKIKNPDADGIGEILVKGENVMMGYFEDPEATASVFEDGWFKTGDFGYIDEDGYLFFVGRMKNLIVLSNGKNVSPEELEEQIKRKIEYVSEIVIYGENDTLTAEVFLNEELNPKAREDVKKDIDEFNKSVAVFKRIRNIKIRDTEFPKTTSMKIKRSYK